MVRKLFSIENTGNLVKIQLLCLCLMSVLVYHYQGHWFSSKSTKDVDVKVCYLTLPGESQGNVACELVVSSVLGLNKKTVHY